MTLEELGKWDCRKYKFEEWEEELKRRKKVEKKVSKLSDEIDGEANSLTVLADEIGSERWMKHNNRMCNLIVKRDRLLKEMEEWE